MPTAHSSDRSHVSACSSNNGGIQRVELSWNLWNDGAYELQGSATAGARSKWSIHQVSGTLYLRARQFVRDEI